MWLIRFCTHPTPAQSRDTSLLDRLSCVRNGIVGANVDVFGVRMVLVHIVDCDMAIVCDEDGYMIAHKLTDIRLV